MATLATLKSILLFFGFLAISDLRKTFGVPNIYEVAKFVKHKEASSQRKRFRAYLPAGPLTRNRTSSNIPLPDERAWIGERVHTILTKAGNPLPKDAKECSDTAKA